MPVTEDEVVQALRPVQEPGLRRSIVDLGMVRDVSTGWRGGVTVALALPMPGWPYEDTVDQIVTAVAALPGVQRVEVDPVMMTEGERHALRDTLQPAGTTHENAGQAGHGHAHGPTTATPIMERGSRTRVLGISSGKGGVGKSSVTVNLAVTLARLGHEVGVLDADVYGFSVPKMLGIAGDPFVIEGLVIPPVAYGVRAFSMGLLVEDDQPVIWRGPMLHKYLEQFLTDVYWGEPDYFLIDMPPGTGDVALSLAQYLPRAEVYVVTTPQPAAQRVAQRSAYMAKKLNLPVHGVIENMSWFTGDDGRRYELFGAGGGQALADELGVPLLGQVPLVPAVRQGGDEGVPVTAVDPEGEAGLAFEDIAHHIEASGPKKVYRKELTIR